MLRGLDGCLVHRWRPSDSRCLLVRLDRWRHPLVLLLLLKMLWVLLLHLLGMLWMLSMLLHLLGVLLLRMLLHLLGLRRRSMCDLLRGSGPLALPRGWRRSGSRCRLLLLLLRRHGRLRLLGMSHGRLDLSWMVLLLAGMRRRRGTIRSEMGLLLLRLTPRHIRRGLRIMLLCAVPVWMVSELLRLWLLLLRRRLLQRWHRRRLLLTLPCLHVAGARALLHRR